MLNCNYTCGPHMPVVDSNEYVLKNIMEYPDHARKVIRLIAKQYKIYSIYRHPLKLEDYIYTQQIIIEYYRQELGYEEIFIWRIEIR